MYSNVMGQLYGAYGEDGEDCMSVIQILAATRTLCKEQRNNKHLWQQVIDCHRPMSDEVQLYLLFVIFDYFNCNCNNNLVYASER